MKFIKIFCLCFLVYLLPANADTGCLYSSGYIYKSPNGNYNGNPPGSPGYGSYPNYRYVSEADRVMRGLVYCAKESSSPCRINGNNNPSDWGLLITFSITECPIDDYIPHMIFGISILGFFYIRRRNLLHSV